MTERWQSLALVLIILVSVAATGAGGGGETAAEVVRPPAAPEARPAAGAYGNVAFDRASVIEAVGTARAPARKWDVPDPAVSAPSALAYSLDDDLTLFSRGAEVARPLASLSKLLTAAAVLENLGENKKVPVMDEALRGAGPAGGLRSGEVYTSGDLLRIMLIASSNGAAQALAGAGLPAEQGNGPAAFLRLLRDEALKIGMTETHLEDGSGLSPANRAPASDVLRLIRYLLAHYPEVLTWTRLPHFLAQPLNDPATHTVYNVNPLAADSRFLGGKTGTSEHAGENLAAVLALHDRRVALIILGSDNRLRDMESLAAWLGRAYAW